MKTVIIHDPKGDSAALLAHPHNLPVTIIGSYEELLDYMHCNGLAVEPSFLKLVYLCRDECF